MLGTEVWDYFLNYEGKNYTDGDFDHIMTHRKEQILNTTYVEKDVLISLLLENDIDLKSFVESEKEDSFSDFKTNRVVTENIIIGNSSFDKDVVIDGYHRIIQQIINKKTHIRAFIPTTSKFI